MNIQLIITAKDIIGPLIEATPDWVLWIIGILSACGIARIIYYFSHK